MKRKISEWAVALRFLSEKKEQLGIKGNAYKRHLLSFIDRKPLPSFFILLGFFLLLILLGNIIRQPKATPIAQAPIPKKVTISSIGQNPVVTVTAKIDKSGIIKLVAQAPGVVSKITLSEGDHIARGQSLLFLSTNYQGGTAASVTRQIAQKNLNFVQSSYPTQKDMIQKRRDIAGLADGQADKLRDIANQSIADTQSLITLDEEIITSIDAQIQQLIDTNVGGANDSLILQAKEAKAGVLTGLNAQKAALRNTQYQASGDSEPAHLSDATRELTQKQLDIEDRSVDLNLEISRLNLRLSQIGESLMFPASPSDGVVERINVHVGDTVTPGTLLATIAANKSSMTAVAVVSSDFAKSMSRLEKSKLTFGNRTIELTPRYISSEPTDGTLHSVLFSIPDEFSPDLAEGAYISVEIPVGTSMSAASVPFVPLDALYQTQTSAYVFIASPSAAGTFTVESRLVEIGQVIGSYIEVPHGLSVGDQVVVNRNVVAGDSVTIQ